jgi:SMI1/KNR4 family protein SUKH-1
MNLIIPRFVDAALAKLRGADMMRLPLPKMPSEMHDTSIAPSNDWIGWKAIPSTVTDLQLDALEEDLELRYPPLYRDFLQFKHFYELGSLVRFVEHPVDAWEKNLREAYQAWVPQRIVGIGLIPFGDETMMDAGPVCFDTRSRSADGDCPVLFWDHEWVGMDKEIQPMFSSSAAMFKCLSFAVESDLGFTYHDSRTDDPATLPPKKALMRQFLDLDPDGAGGVAKDYWTTWGVKPDS